MPAVTYTITEASFLHKHGDVGGDQHCIKENSQEMHVFTMASSSELDRISVVVDEQSQVVCNVAHNRLYYFLKRQQPVTVAVRNQSRDGEVCITGMFLRKLAFANFSHGIRPAVFSRTLTTIWNG